MKPSNITNPAVWARYGAHLIAMILGAAVALLLHGGGTFAPLVSQAFAVAVAVLAGGWAVTVLTIFSDTGDVPALPPAAEPPPAPPTPLVRP